ncbi:peroxisomal copper amine oxidase [Mayamaea pseudoterrestris]|nr:peroxisomal copper amine oxidase [Mayamaea pseudoterrestris]
MTESDDSQVKNTFWGDNFDELNEADIQPPNDANGEDVHLHWRRDPEVSHSDWTIQIVVKDELSDSTVVEYKVHRCILTIGPRKCGYFERVCRNNSDFQESSTRTSVIALPKIAADAFPDFLDYQYQGVSQQSFELTSHSATALHFLSQYFDVHSLRWETMNYIKENLCMANCHEYYHHAYILENKQVLGVLVGFCADEFLKINHQNCKLVEVAEPQFWILVVKKFTSRRGANINTSKIISYVCCNRALDLETFHELTKEDYMPRIYSSAALSLLNAEAELSKVENVSKLSTLQERCIVSLTWNNRFLINDDTVIENLQKQGALFLSKLLIKNVRRVALFGSDLEELKTQCEHFWIGINNGYCHLDDYHTHAPSQKQGCPPGAQRFVEHASQLGARSFHASHFFEGILVVASSWLSSHYKTMHPLDPLSISEVQAAVDAIRTSVSVTFADDPLADKLRFVAVSLHEPPKAQVLALEVTFRQAFVLTLNPVTGLATEYIVQLDEGDATIVSSKTLPPGTQPMLTPDDCDLAEQIVKTSNQVKHALLERYNIDVSRVACDPWSIHLASHEDTQLVNYNGDKPAQLVQTFLYLRCYGNGLEDNHYAHPIDILPIVNLNTRQLVRIDGLDRLPAPKIPTDAVQYHRDLLHTNSYLQTEWRSETLKALDIIQPDGHSFTVTDGYHVDWQKWSFRVGFNYREGLVLHDVQFQNRSILHRASLVEMAVPYADPYPPHQRKCAMDVGDYGLGFSSNSLELGCDCLGKIYYFDAVLVDSTGTPQNKKKVICMHEEDGGLLYKHVDYRNGHNESRRSRELVVSFVATVVNYEYLFYWRFKQDGTIDYEIKLSGELSTNLLSAQEGDHPTHGVMVAPCVNAQIHQHMFCARLDMAVDGQRNNVSEIDVVSAELDPVKNPYGNAFYTVETQLDFEKNAIRIADMTKARVWKISNAMGKTNSVNGKATAYKLIPFTKGPAQPTLLVDPSCAVAMKGAFAKANLWVTPYSPDEMWPAGDYTPQGVSAAGLPSWTQANRSLVDEDLVMWHVFGVCHVPRAEDFPIMPCEVSGFTLKPDNFFAGNPAIDLIPEVNGASKLASQCCSA